MRTAENSLPPEAVKLGANPLGQGVSPEDVIGVLKQFIDPKLIIASVLTSIVGTGLYIWAGEKFIKNRAKRAQEEVEKKSS